MKPKVRAAGTTRPDMTPRWVASMNVCSNMPVQEMKLTRSASVTVRPNVLIFAPTCSSCQYGPRPACGMPSYVLEVLLKFPLLPPGIEARHIARDPIGKVCRTLLHERRYSFLGVGGHSAFHESSALDFVRFHGMVAPQHPPHHLARERDRDGGGVVDETAGKRARGGHQLRRRMQGADQVSLQRFLCTHQSSGVAPLEGRRNADDAGQEPSRSRLG